MRAALGRGARPAVWCSAADASVSRGACPPPGVLAAPTATALQRRRKSTAYKPNLLRQRAHEHHIDWLRQRKPPTPRRQHEDYVGQLEPPRQQRQYEVDPKLRKPVEELRQVFNQPELVKQPSHDQALKPLASLWNPTYEGLIGKVDLEPFGCIEVVQGDLFTAEVDAVLIPMAPNLVPYRGLGLEVFDRGGAALVKETFATAKEQYTREHGDGSTDGVQAGDTVVVPSRGLKAKNIMFVIMPWFWEGSPMDAGKRLRFCVQRALARAGPSYGFSHVALPSLGAGVFGYEPRGSSRAMLEEAVEALLQVEAQTPSYELKRVTFMDTRRETAEELHDALVEVSHRWLPDRRMTTAGQYWGEATRRLIVLPSVPNWFLKREAVKFKKFHGVKRKARRNYIGNVATKLWRVHKVHQPPPLLVYRQTGAVAPHDRQLRARPYFFRGVTHWLFPSRRSGFHNLRVSSRGQWVAHLQNFPWAASVRPRL